MILTYQTLKLLKCNFKIKTIHYLKFHYMSQIFPPLKEGTLKANGSESLSQKLLFDFGIISHQHNGIYALLPLGLRAVEKLIKIIDHHMGRANCQKLSLPHLCSSSLWKKSGRLETCGTEIFRLKDRNQHEFILSPTHEEAITYLLSSIKPFSYSHLPLRLYQISTKFRDELRCKHGLMRGREFLMKDLYTFDKSTEAAKLTYEKIVQLYTEIFKTLNVSVEKVKASVGSIGGTESHEFHILGDIGEDSILSCYSCKFMTNIEMANEFTNICPNCKGELTNIKGIEVAHSFLLGTKYSEPMSASFMTVDQMSEPLHMGCYGIGITRLLAASIESLSKENHITWPTGIVPFKVCIIPPKKDNVDYQNSHWSTYLANIINKIPGYENEIIIDDRIKLSIGRRLNYAKRFGFPFIIVIGKSSIESIEQVPRFEVIYKNETRLLQQADVLQLLKTVQC